MDSTTIAVIVDALEKIVKDIESGRSDRAVNALRLTLRLLRDERDAAPVGSLRDEVERLEALAVFEQAHTPTIEDVRNHYAYGCGPEHTWAESREDFDRWLSEHDRQVAERAWDRCVGEMPIDPDWKNFYSDQNPYTKGEQK